MQVSKVWLDNYWTKIQSFKYCPGKEQSLLNVCSNPLELGEIVHPNPGFGQTLHKNLVDLKNFTWQNNIGIG